MFGRRIVLVVMPPSVELRDGGEGLKLSVSFILACGGSLAIGYMASVELRFCGTISRFLGALKFTIKLHVKID